MTKISKLAYKGGYVRRWHTTNYLNQSVAEHSWGVALIIIQNHPNPSANLLKAALLHDLHEVRFGDMPAPAKRRFPAIGVVEEVVKKEFFKDCSIEYPALTEEEQWWLDLADKIESLVFLEEQQDERTVAQMAMSAAQMISELYEKGQKFGVELVP